MRKRRCRWRTRRLAIVGPLESMSEFRDQDLAYAAGLIDGEGCIGIYRLGNHYRANVNVQMTHEAAVRWLHEHFAGTFRAISKVGMGNREKQHRWDLHQKDKIVSFISSVYPFLIVKRLQALVVLEYCKRFPSKLPGTRYSEEEKEEMRRYYQIMSVANSRGPGSNDNKVRLFDALMPGEREKQRA